MRRLILASAAALMAVAAAQGAWAQAPASVTAELKNSTGQTVGGVTLTEAPKGVVIRIEAKAIFYDYQAKYFSDETRYLCPCGLAPDSEKRFAEISADAFDRRPSQTDRSRYRCPRPQMKSSEKRS